MKKSAVHEWAGNPYKRPRSPYWSFVFRDASGVVRRRSARTKDLRIARERLAEAQREAELARAGHIDQFAETRTAPLSKLVLEYAEHLKAEECNPRYTKETLRQIRAYLRFAKVPTVPAIKVQDAERFLSAVRTRTSVRTRDHHAAALRAFGRWLERTGRWSSDPFRGLIVRTAHRDRHLVFKRMSFRFSDAERLVDGAWARHEAEKKLGGMPTQYDYHFGEAVRDRQTLYWLVLTTALRYSECAAVCWEDLDLVGDRPCVRLSGRFTKNGQDARVPLQEFVAAALRAMRQRHDATLMRRKAGAIQETDRVFRMPSKLAEIVRKDAQFAGLISERGAMAKRVDFHCLRKSCCRILIELGLHPKVIQQTLRHSDVRLTLDIYGELGEDDLFRELPGKFPVPAMFAPKQEEPATAAPATA